MIQPLAPGGLRVSTLREQVADLIRRAIVEMRFMPGDRLVERELIEWTGVSRATVREALRELATEGLVRTIPQKGAVVASPSLREAAEVYEVRAALEGLAGRLFAERADASQREALARAYEKVREVLGSGSDTWSMLEAKNAFYAVLLEGADNAAMVSMLGLLQARITMLRATSMTQPGRSAEAIAEIGEIVRAIEARDGDAAAAAAAYHVQRAGHYALAALSAASDGQVINPPESPRH